MPSRSLGIAALSIVLCSAQLASPAQSQSDTQKSSFKQYFNPLRKQGYVNTSQDRQIKKTHCQFVDADNSVRVANRELGLFAIMPPEKSLDTTYAEQLLSDQKVSGIAVALPWSTLEPSEDKFDWQPLDNLLQACHQHGKTAIVYITTAGLDLKPANGGSSTAADTPAWVFAGGAQSIAWQSNDGAAHTMPIFWDKNYLAKWSNFIAEFAQRYDCNPDIHSVGITGGGMLTGTQVVPASATVADANGSAQNLAAVLKAKYGMNQRQLVEHWKYVADIFTKNFHKTRLNFEINPPVAGRMGEDSLDEIADYLAYRFGERVYLTRTGFNSGKHSFNDYRILLKFRNDTLTGVKLTDSVNIRELDKIAGHALDDGVSFVAVPPALLASDEPSVKAALQRLSCNVGYRIICEKVSVPSKVASGEPLRASFAFVNTGAAAALRPERNLDKDSAASYRVALELCDAQGKPVLMNLHTPPVSTCQWQTGKPISWEKELRMIDADKHQLPPGDYSVWLSIVDADAKQRVSFLAVGESGKLAPVEKAKVGMLTIANAVAQTQTETNEEKIQH